MKQLVSLGLTFFILAVPVDAENPTPGPLTLWYAQPASNAMNEALPVGNGRIGGLVFGGVDRERIVLNEDTLWTGTGKSEFGWKSYGSYQVMGNLFLDCHIGPATTISSPSGHAGSQESEDIQKSVDGDSNTKWCVEFKNAPVIWQLETDSALVPATSYTLVSANDTPERDPRSWEFFGSQDGQQWTSLDRQADQAPFPGRQQAKTFTFANTTAYKFYRLSITDNNGDRLVQLAEISIPGVSAVLANQPVTDYRRELDLSTAIATTRFTRDGVSYVREVFSSHPDNVLVVHWGASAPGSISGTILLRGGHEEQLKIDGNAISFVGNLPNGQQYETIAHILKKGGAVEQVGGTLQVKGADELLILIATGTDYVPDVSKHFQSGISPHDSLVQQLDAAGKKTYEEIKHDHITDHQALFNRVALNLGKSTPDQLALPTDKRKVLAATTFDPELEALLFQYGRYLLIGSSRPGSLPANLQGIWNDSNAPQWACDYHVNINLQMNYWGAESANLAECHIPLFDFMKMLAPAWRENSQTEKEFTLPDGPVRGWAVRTGVNVWGGETFEWDKTANAWLCRHLYEHYAFTQDKIFLQQTVYPMLKEIVEFWEDHLKTLPDGRLVVPNGWSPEHGPHEDGVSYNQQIVWDLFTNYMAAADALGIDKDYRDKIMGLRDKLVGPEIGKWGQLKEWRVDRDDPNDHHRHTSNLFAVYPGRQVTAEQTPDLIKAAKVSLDARGPTGDVREWSFAWRTALYARMHDGNDAHLMFENLFSNRNTCLNLFGYHPPLQLDGNFGITAAVVEMLVQSHEGDINLLPALPQDWAEGSVRGLRARGAFEVDIAWKDGALSSATIRSVGGTEANVCYQSKRVTLQLTPGQAIQLDGNLKAIVP
jgi:alpha-L-fucosidase 2